MGTEVTLNYNFNGTTSTDIFTVVPDMEVVCTGNGGGNANICEILTGPSQSIDFGNDYILYNYVRSGWAAQFLDVDPNGFEFLFPNITIHDVVLDTTIVGLDASRLTFDVHSIRLNMQGLNLNDVDSFRLAVSTPEPSAGVLAGLGGLLVVAAGYLRKRAGDKIGSCNPQDPASPRSAT